MKETDAGQPTREAYIISLLRVAAYGVLALAAFAVLLAGNPEPGLASFKRLSAALSSSAISSTSSRIKWSACPDDSAYECAFFAVPINVRESTEAGMHIMLTSSS